MTRSATGRNYNSLTNFDGGVAPPASVLFPAGFPYSPGSGQAVVTFMADSNPMDVREGTLYHNVQRQLNFVDTFAWTVGVHQLKLGIDYRRLNPTSGGSRNYSAGQGPGGFQVLVLGNVGAIGTGDKYPVSVKINNYSLFAQDTWRITNQLTVTYGLRWEIDSPPESATSGQPLYRVQGIFDSSALAIVPGSSWHTKFDNFAPRIGAAYQVTSKTVVRGGFGLFYDLGYGNAGDASASFPYFPIQFTFEPGLGCLSI